MTGTSHTRTYTQRHVAMERPAGIPTGSVSSICKPNIQNVPGRQIVVFYSIQESLCTSIVYVIIQRQRCRLNNACLIHVCMSGS